MGRNRKQGLDYYPLDIDFFQDIKIRKLIKRQSGKAVTVYTLLLCLIYKDGYYIKWDKELPFIISEQTGFDEAFIRQAIDCCLALGLFDAGLFNENKVITSRSIQERYSYICGKSRRKCCIDEFSLLDAPQEPEPNPGEEAIIDEMKHSPMWIEQIANLHNLTNEDVAKRIDDFALYNKCRDVKHEGGIQDAKRHFNDWLRIQLENERKPKTDGQTKQNRRRPSKAVTATEEDFKTSF